MKIGLFLLSCLIFAMSACGAHNHSYSDADCVSPAVCSSCGTEIAPPLGHTVKVGVCSRCGEVQNEKLLAVINTDFAKIMDEGRKLFPCIADIPTLDSNEQFKAFQIADSYTQKMREQYSDIINACSSEEELCFLVYQTKLLDAASPPKISGADAAFLANNAVLYQMYLQQISSSFNYLSIEMDRLAGNSNEANMVGFFDEAPEIPTPDSVIFDITYDSKKVESDIVLYTYLLGEDETTATMNYNNYLSAVDMSDNLSVSIEDTYCYISRNGTTVSVMKAGEDDEKGYFLTVSFPKHKKKINFSMRKKFCLAPPSRTQMSVNDAVGNDTCA